MGNKELNISIISSSDVKYNFPKKTNHLIQDAYKKDRIYKISLLENIN